jgi:hypothetical protein
MSTRVLKRFLQMFCGHKFSWPHSGVHGRDYQVCLLCGSTYEYDWRTMRRTRRLAARPRADLQRAFELSTTHTRTTSSSGYRV